jgi:hypothetical protein
LGDEKWHQEFFSFINDGKLAARLGEEFFSTRFIYKILEGINADKGLLRAQVRIQVLSYASIYEAVIHHILFERLPTDPAVAQLTEFPTKKEIAIPQGQMAIIKAHLRHAGHEIIPTYAAVGKTDISKVRFDKKAECAQSLGFISRRLRDELTELYEARNAIHIHAEIRKSLQYQIDLSRLAYRRMAPFKEQVTNKLAKLGLL